MNSRWNSEGDREPTAKNATVSTTRTFSRFVRETRDDRLTLARMIAREIAPRLLVSMSKSKTATARFDDGQDLRRNAVPPSRDAKSLLALLLADDREALDDYYEWLIGADLSFDVAYRELIEPAAAALGDLWVDDRASFFDVTVAVSRLRSIILEWLNTHPQPVDSGDDRQRRVMLARLRTEAHSIGLLVADCCFRSAGWVVRGGEDRAVDDRLFAELGSGPFTVLGLSVGSLTPMGELRSVIEAARARSWNTDIKICVGGAFVAANEDLCAEVGADFAIADAFEAVSVIEAAMR